jgi:hypothetical protein
LRPHAASFGIACILDLHLLRCLDLAHCLCCLARLPFNVTQATRFADRTRRSATRATTRLHSGAGRKKGCKVILTLTTHSTITRRWSCGRRSLAWGPSSSLACSSTGSPRAPHPEPAALASAFAPPRALFPRRSMLWHAESASPVLAGSTSTCTPRRHTRSCASVTNPCPGETVVRIS